VFSLLTAMAVTVALRLSRLTAIIATLAVVWQSCAVHPPVNTAPITAQQPPCPSTLSLEADVEWKITCLPMEAYSEGLLLQTQRPVKLKQPSWSRFLNGVCTASSGC